MDVGLHWATLLTVVSWFSVRDVSALPGRL
jgi:hypothetical protein